MSVETVPVRPSLVDLTAAYAKILYSRVDVADGTQDTPLRAAKAFVEMTSGYDTDIDELITTFDGEGYDEMIAGVGLPFTSLCEHHMLPFVGECSIVYLPTSKIIGLSKLPRLLRAFARRLQNQERLTQQIADALVEHLSPIGVLVWIEAHHTCMSARGIESPGLMRTSVTRGAMRDKPATRAEALALIERKGR